MTTTRAFHLIQYIAPIDSIEVVELETITLLSGEAIERQILHKVDAAFDTNTLTPEAKAAADAAIALRAQFAAANA